MSDDSHIAQWISSNDGINEALKTAVDSGLRSVTKQFVNWAMEKYLPSFNFTELLNPLVDIIFNYVAQKFGWQ